MNKTTFYDAIRVKFKLTNRNVAGFDFILDEAGKAGISLHNLAYILATTWHETAFTMQPIKEYGGNSYFTRRYDIKGNNPKLAKQLGNTSPGDGAKYCGRGYVMITGKNNYARASKELGIDFVTNPDLVMQPKYAIKILFEGMLNGWFTGKQLDDYVDDIDESDKEDLREFSNARRIVNGTDKQVAIGMFAIVFETALKLAKYDPREAVQSVPEKSATDVPEGVSPSLWAAIVALVKSLIGGNK